MLNTFILIDLLLPTLNEPKLLKRYLRVVFITIAFLFYFFTVFFFFLIGRDYFVHIFQTCKYFYCLYFHLRFFFVFMEEKLFF